MQSIQEEARLMCFHSICEELSVSRDIFEMRENDSRQVSIVCDDDFDRLLNSSCGVTNDTTSLPTQAREAKSISLDGISEPSLALTDLIQLNLRGMGHHHSVLERPETHFQPLASGFDALHRACCNPKVSCSEIEILIRRDPFAASRSAVLRSVKAVYSPILQRSTNKVVKEPYTYPLNLAIVNKASSQVIELLIDAAPEILATKDGSLQETPLALFLKYHPHDVSTFDKMLLDCPYSSGIKDRQDNTLAHIGARQGVAVEMMRHITILYPDSLTARNFHGLTPIELAQQRTSTSSEAIAQFLWEQQAKQTFS